MILSAQSIREAKPIEPFFERTVVRGMTFGLSCHGYDVRIAEDVFLGPGEFRLASTIEHFDMPRHLAAVVHDKSSYARRGLSVFNTVIEAGWRGFLTLELVNKGHGDMFISAGDPIAQIMFHMLDQPTEQPYTGKYQDQQAGPQPARFE